MSETRPMAPMQIGTTNRGFALYEFIDRYGEQCSLQKSSLATEDCIWFGVTDDKRMHLTVEMVAAVLPALQHFVATGELPGAPSTPPLPPSPRCGECGHRESMHLAGYECVELSGDGECKCPEFRPAPSPPSETPPTRQFCHNRLNGGRHVCRFAPGHDGPCHPHINASSLEPTPRVSGAPAGETPTVRAKLDAVVDLGFVVMSPEHYGELRERAERAEAVVAAAEMVSDAWGDIPFGCKAFENIIADLRAALLRSSASTTDSGSGT